MTIVWSQKAGETFQRNIDSLQENPIKASIF